MEANSELNEILKLADELGIKCEINNENPGFFITEGNGRLQEITLEEIMFILKQ